MRQPPQSEKRYKVEKRKDLEGNDAVPGEEKKGPKQKKGGLILNKAKGFEIPREEKQRRSAQLSALEETHLLKEIEF